jgi:hypothetical protein
VVFPELLRGVLARDALEDFRAAGVFVYEACSSLSTFADFLESDMVWEGDVAGERGGEWGREGDLFGGLLGGREMLGIREGWGQGEGKMGERTSDVVHVLVDYYIHPALGIFMRCYVGDGECF